MKFKTKSILKKVALGLAGVTALTAVGFGVKALVDYTKSDLKTITPTFEVGNLGSDGKYVNDDSTLYTKEEFACYGLQVKPDFDSTVNYQVFFYDLSDNFVSSTDMLSEGFLNDIPLDGVYARIVIEPQDDEDGKISWSEKYTYPNQLTFKVNKNQDVATRFVAFGGKTMLVVSDTSNLVFSSGILDSNLNWTSDGHNAITSKTLLQVSGGLTFNIDYSSLSGTSCSCIVYEFNAIPSNESVVAIKQVDGSLVLDKTTKYIIISVYGTNSWTDANLALLPSCISVTKIK
jgi:hypothetical protein